MRMLSAMICLAAVAIPIRPEAHCRSSDMPTTVAGMSLDRQCASGLMGIATAAKQIIADNMRITVGGAEAVHVLVLHEAYRFEPAAQAAGRFDKEIVPLPTT